MLKVGHCEAPGHEFYYLCCRLVSGGIVTASVRPSVCLSVCVSAESWLHAVDDEGNALYPVLLAQLDEMCLC